MKKTLYSLTLSDDVVQAVDAAAHRMGVSRSALVNQILSEYVSVPTPESRISDIFTAIENLVSPGRELVPFFAPGSPILSLKSSLTYKYRPTVRYGVELNGSGGDGAMGELSVVFRTQSASLIDAMTSFFRLWTRIEDAHLAPLLGAHIECALYDGRFVRPLAMPRGGAGSGAEDVAEAISGYVQLFDRLLKGFLSGELSPADVERAYVADLKRRKLLI
jgi:hypothetical protein